MSFSSGFAPKIYNRDGSQQLLDPDVVKLGYYIEVAGSVEGNNNQGNPGVYLNHSMVALAGYGEEIHTGPDASSVGFGGAALPPGASATPVGGQFNPQQNFGGPQDPLAYGNQQAPQGGQGGYPPQQAPQGGQGGYPPQQAPQGGQGGYPPQPNNGFAK